MCVYSRVGIQCIWRHSNLHSWAFLSHTQQPSAVECVHNQLMVPRTHCLAGIKDVAPPKWPPHISPYNVYMEPIQYRYRCVCVYACMHEGIQSAISWYMCAVCMDGPQCLWLQAHAYILCHPTLSASVLVPPNGSSTTTVSIAFLPLSLSVCERAILVCVCVCKGIWESCDTAWLLFTSCSHCVWVGRSLGEWIEKARGYYWMVLDSHNT